MEKEVLEQMMAMNEEAKKITTHIDPDDMYVKGPHFFDGIKTKEQADIFKLITYALIGKTYKIE
jgi:hypothetical protein